MGFIAILCLGFSAFMLWLMLTVFVVLCGPWRTKDVWDVAVFFFGLIFIGTFVTEVFWMFGWIELNQSNSIIAVDQEIKKPKEIEKPVQSNEPSEAWKFLTTPVWEIGKDKE